MFRLLRNVRRRGGVGEGGRQAFYAGRNAPVGVGAPRVRDLRSRVGNKHGSSGLGKAQPQESIPSCEVKIDSYGRAVRSRPMLVLMYRLQGPGLRGGFVKKAKR